MSPKAQIVVREPVERDEEALLGLLDELGYPADSQTLAARLDRLRQDPASWVFVAEVDGEVVGLAALHVMQLLERPPLGRLTALVVDGRHRGRDRPCAYGAAVVFRGAARGTRSSWRHRCHVLGWTVGEANG